MAIYLRPPSRSTVLQLSATYGPTRRRVLRFPVRRITRLREEKKNRPDICVRRPGSGIVSQSSATCDPWAMNEKSCFRTIKTLQLHDASEMEYHFISPMNIQLRRQESGRKCYRNFELLENNLFFK